MMPMTSGTAIVPFRMPDTGAGVPVDNRTVTYVVTPGYAEALRAAAARRPLPQRAGCRPGPRAMVVNDEFVRRYRIAPPVIGRRFQNVLPSDTDVTTEIVGIVAPVLKDGNDRQPQPRGVHHARPVGPAH